MAEVNPCWSLDTQTMQAETVRQLVFALREVAGVSAPGHLAVSAGGGLNVSIAGGLAIVDGTENPLGQGSYVCANLGSVIRSLAAADQTNPRNDIVVAKVQDAQYSGATRAWSLAVVTGSPSGFPVDPALPANSLALARVVVPAGSVAIAAGNITDLRVFVSGMVIPGASGFVVRNSANAFNNLQVADSGLITLRNALVIPPAVGVAPAPTSFGSTMVKIAEAVVGSVVSAVTFSSVPQSFRMLLLQGYGLSDGFTDAFLKYRANSDTSTSYDFQGVSGGGTTVSAASASGATSGQIGTVIGNNNATISGNAVYCVFPNYSSSAAGKIALSYSARGVFGSTVLTLELMIGLFRGTNPLAGISNLQLFPSANNFQVGTIFSLYGIP